MPTTTTQRHPTWLSGKTYSFTTQGYIIKDMHSIFFKVTSMVLCYNQFLRLSSHWISSNKIVVSLPSVSWGLESTTHENASPPRNLRLSWHGRWNDSVFVGECVQQRVNYRWGDYLICNEFIRLFNSPSGGYRYHVSANHNTWISFMTILKSVSWQPTDCCCIQRSSITLSNTGSWMQSPFICKSKMCKSESPC